MKTFLMLVASLFFVATTDADYILKYKMDTEIQTYMYKSDTSSKLVTGSGDERSEIYKIGKKVYIVSYDDGEKSVIDMDEMKKMSQAFGGIDSSAYMQKNETPKYTIKKTGRKEKVGGINGEVWIVSGEDNGEKFKEEMVVTNDKRVAKAVHSMFATLSSMGGPDLENNFLELKKGYVVIKADSMALQSFSEKKLPNADYQLPKDAKEQKMPNFSKAKAQSLDSCYNKVCCGQTSGDSKVLATAIKSSFNGYKLIGSGVCDAMGLGSLLGITTVEGALYKKGDDYIQVTLNLDDQKGGMLRSTKKNLDSGHSLGVVDSIQHYSDNKKVDGIQVVSGVLMPMNQETFEYIIDNKTSLTVSRLRKTGKESSLSKVVSSGGINLKKLKSSVSSQNSSASKSTPNKDEDMNKNINQEVDKAVNMLKSFF